MTKFACRVLRWYSRNARILPWRSRVDPYRTWVSEVMLQQTRVETVLPYFDRWLARFPSIRELAAASESTVLGVWEGLGYYSRARNLHRAARLIVREFDGRIPSDTGTLRQLPGIGPYTAGAVASIAFGRDEPVLDGNIHRVFARAFYVKAAVKSRAAEKRLWSLATEHLPQGRAGEFNQALMDLGSMVCLPRHPRCDACPVDAVCEARKRGMQARLPVRERRRPLPHLVVGAAVITRRDHVLIVRRASKGLLGGLWEFPKATLSTTPRNVRELESRLPAALEEAYALKVRNPRPLGVIQHAYSHFRVTVHAFRCGTGSAASRVGFRWVTTNRLSQYPMGRVDRRIAERLQHSKA